MTAQDWSQPKQKGGGWQGARGFCSQKFFSKAKLLGKGFILFHSDPAPLLGHFRISAGGHSF